MKDYLSQAEIQKRIDESLSLSIEVHDCLSSTNHRVRDAAKEGVAEGLVVIADRQTEGYGRYGRPFFSPGGCGLYMSILLRPNECPNVALRITTAAAVAVAEAIEEVTGRSCGIKWVNDLFLDGKKVSGILTEGGINPETGRMDYTVLGIGVNVTTPPDGYDEVLRGVAGAILAHSEHEVRNHLAATILQRFFHYYQDIMNRDLLVSYRRRLFFLGQTVRVLRMGREACEGVALDIDEDFHLLVRYEDGLTEALSSGEISIQLT